MSITPERYAALAPGQRAHANLIWSPRARGLIEQTHALYESWLEAPLLACLLDGQGLQFLPQWSAAPYLARGELVELMPEYWREPSAFGPWIYVLYQAHRRNTRKVKVFIDFLTAHWQAT